MNDRQVSCFLWAATYGNYRRAAEHLSLTQPTVSYQVGELERELGFPLFARSGRGVSLTEAGRALYQDLLVVREQLDGAVSRARSIASSRGAALVVGWPATICDRRLIAAAVESWRSLHPAERIDVVATDRVGDLLAAGGRRADVAVTLVEDRDPEGGLEYVELCAMQSSCQVCPSHPLARAGSVTFSDLESQTVYMVPPGSYLGRYDRMVEALRSHRPQLDVRFVDGQSDIEVNVLCGSGVCIRPVPVAHLNAEYAGAVAVPLDPPRTVHLALAHAPGNGRAAEFCACAAGALRAVLCQGD